MKICVAGLWHLGSVTAACLAAAGHQVLGFDPDASVVAALSGGRAPVFEPGLDDLVATNVAAGRLRFSDDRSIVAQVDVVWIAFDTPVDDDDRADVASVLRHVEGLFPFVRDGALMIVSSQVPVGTTDRLEAAFRQQASGRTVHFAYSPENLRLGHAIKAFTEVDRVVVGVGSDAAKTLAAEVLRPVTDRIEWMSVPSAEMTKHALNAFLATSVTFANELAAICEQVGADASDVERGLKSEGRIGRKAYLAPGAAFAGGTLARDVQFLSALAAAVHVPTPLLSSIKTSNDAHRGWALRRLKNLLGSLAGHTVAVWGLTYKVGTDTLRRSSAVELCRILHEEGATVRAHDPAVTAVPPDLSFIELAGGLLETLDGASALVIGNGSPEFASVAASELSARMVRPLVLDASRVAATSLAAAGIEYVTVGKSSK